MRDDSSGNRSERLEYDKKGYQKAQKNGQGRKQIDNKDEEHFEDAKEQFNKKNK